MKTQTEQASSSEVVKTLAQVLAKAKKFSGPALLMVEFPTEYTRKKTAEELAKTLKEADDELVDIDLRKPINLLEIIEELKPNQVGSVHGLHAQPEVVRRLNWGRERLTDNNKRIVFWLNFEELKDLAERAPDFWAFRSRLITLQIYDSKDKDFFLNVDFGRRSRITNLPKEQKSDRIEALEELLLGARNSSSKTQLIREDLGHLYEITGQYEKARKVFKEALEVSREVGDKKREGDWLDNLGIIHMRLGQMNEAIQYYQKALEISREVGDTVGENCTLGNIGNVLTRLGRFEEANTYYQEALELSRKIGNKKNEATWIGNIANLYFHKGDVEKAIELHSVAASLFQKLQDRRGEADQFNNMGNCYYILSNLEIAIEVYQKALMVAQDIGDKRLEASALGNLGNAHTDLGELEKGANYLQQALRISIKIGDRKIETNALLGLADIFQEENKPVKSLACLVVVLHYSMDLGRSQRILSQIHELSDQIAEFKSTLYSLFSNGDKILQEATGQPYKFFLNAPADTPNKILTMLKEFEKQQKGEELVK